LAIYKTNFPYHPLEETPLFKAGRMSLDISSRHFYSNFANTPVYTGDESEAVNKLVEDKVREHCGPWSAVVYT
jgi:hypothetical protein